MHAVKYVEREFDKDLEIELAIEEMGRKLNLSHLTEEECKHILEVIQRDFKLRQCEAQRVGKLQDDINQEHAKGTILSKQKKFNKSYCMRCFSTFFFIFNRRIQCINCGYNVCKDCAEWNEKSKEWKCTTCITERNLKEQSCEWFYKQIKTRFRRFGSAKVVRSLYKRKSEAESDQSNSDSGYDHNNISPLSSMYGSNVTLPREQVQTKDSATNTSDSDSDSDSASETDSDPESPSFHTVCQDLERMVVQLRQPEDIGEAIAKFSIGVQVPKDAVREVEGLVLDATDGSGRSHSRRRGKHHRRKHFIRDDGSGIVGSIPSPIEEQITPPIETLPRLDESDTGTPLVNSDDRSSQLESPKKVRFSETPTYVEPSSPEEGSQLSPIKEDIIMNSAPPPDTSALDTEEQLVKDERFMHGLLSGNEGWPRGEVPEGGENGSVDMDQASEGLVDVDEDVTDSSALHAACGLGEDRGDVDGTQTEVLREEQEFTQHENISDFQPSEEISAKESENGKKQPSQTLKSKSESLESASSSSLENNDLSDSIETHFPSESSQSNLSTPATPPPSRASEESNNLNDLDNDIEAEMERLAMSTSTSSETVKSEGYFTPEDIRSPEFMHQLQKFTKDSSDECLSKSEWDRRSMALSEHSTDSNLEYLTPLSETEPFGLDERDKNREAKARIDEELSKSEQLLQEITEAQLFEEKEAIDRVVKEVIESLVNYVVGMCDRLDAVAMETVAKTIVKSSPAKADVKSPVHVSFQSDEIPMPFVNGEISQEFKAEAAVVEVPPEAEETTEILEEPIETVTITQVESVPHDLPDVIKEQVHQHSVQEEEEEVITQETIDPLEQYFITGDSDAASEETIVPSTVQESYTSRTPLPGILPRVRGTGDIENDANSDISDHYEISLEETIDNEPVMRLNIHDQRLLPEYSDEEDTSEDLRPPSYESAITGQHLKDVNEEAEEEVQSNAADKRASFGRIPTIEITEPVKSPDVKGTSPPPEKQAEVTVQQQVPDIVEPNHVENGGAEELSGESDSSISRSPTLEILELEKREKNASEVSAEPANASGSPVEEVATPESFEYERPVHAYADYGDLLYHSPSDEKNGNYIGSLLAAKENPPSPTEYEMDITVVDGIYADEAAGQIPDVAKTTEDLSETRRDLGDDVFDGETADEREVITEEVIGKRVDSSLQASAPKEEAMVSIGALTSESLRRLSEHSQDEEYGIIRPEDHFRVERLSPRHTLRDDLGGDSDSVRSIASSTVASSSDIDYGESEEDEEEMSNKGCSSDEDDIDFYNMASVYEESFKRGSGSMRDMERAHRPTPPPSPKSSPKKKESLEIANLTKKVSLKQGEVLDSAEDVLTSANQMRELNEQVDQLEACISKLEKQVTGRQTSQESNVSYTDTPYSIHPQRQTSMESGAESEPEKPAKRPQEQLVDDVQALEEELLEATVDNRENEQSAASAVRMITDTVLKVITSTEKFISDEQGAEAAEEDLGRLHTTEDSEDDAASKQDDDSWMQIKLEVLEPDILAPEPVRSRIASSKVQEEVANIEERVYMSASKVFSLEERMKLLEGEVDNIDQNSPEQQLVDLEDKVALAIAQVAQSEQQVLSVQERIDSLNRASGGSIGSKYATQYSLDSSLPKQDSGSPPTARAASSKPWSRWVPGPAASAKKPEVPTSLPLGDKDESSFRRGGFVRSSQRKSGAARWRPADASATGTQVESGATGGSETKPSEAEREQVVTGRRGSVKGLTAMFERQSSGDSVSSDKPSESDGSSSQLSRDSSRRGDSLRQRPYKGSVNRTQYYLEKKPGKVQIYTSLR